MAESVIVAGARTPMGRFLGALKGYSATELGGIAISAALNNAGLRGEQVQHVIMGQAIQAGGGQITARQAAYGAGIPLTVPAVTINKVCLSGLSAIALADQLIRAGEFDVVVAGGMESMTNAPHLLPRVRAGVKYGDLAVVDALAHDGLTDPFDHVSMGASTDHYAHRAEIAREDQERFAAQSHARAAHAESAGLFAAEIVPIGPTLTHHRGPTVNADQGIRSETTAATLATLPATFTPNGTITAGTSSQISDGAAAVVVMRKSTAVTLGLPWIAEIGAHGNVAGPDNSLLHQPADAIIDALRKADLGIADLDLIEINEAFAAVALHSIDELGVSEDIVNVNGGALALGHPLGMSGARLVLTLALELQRRGGGTGAAALCGGGGQGDALLLHVPHPAD